MPFSLLTYLSRSGTVLSDLLIPAQTGTKLTSCYIGLGFVPIVRSEPAPPPPQADTVELTA
jgi:hypothetical protein